MGLGGGETRSHCDGPHGKEDYNDCFEWSAHAHSFFLRWDAMFRQMPGRPL